MLSQTFELFADYFQIYLQDEAAAGDLSAAWTEDAVARLLALLPGAIGIGTARNVTVPLEIEVRDRAPEEDLGGWDQVHECSIDVPSGRLVVSGGADYFPDAARVAVAPGPYRARVYYGGLDTLSEDGLEGADRYRVALWPAPLAAPALLKSRPAT